MGQRWMWEARDGFLQDSLQPEQTKKTIDGGEEQGLGEGAVEGLGSAGEGKEVSEEGTSSRPASNSTRGKGSTGQGAERPVGPEWLCI